MRAHIKQPYKNVKKDKDENDQTFLKAINVKGYFNNI